MLLKEFTKLPALCGVLWHFTGRQLECSCMMQGRELLVMRGGGEGREQQRVSIGSRQVLQIRVTGSPSSEENIKMVFKCSYYRCWSICFAQ